MLYLICMKQDSILRKISGCPTEQPMANFVQGLEGYFGDPGFH